MFRALADTHVKKKGQPPTRTFTCSDHMSLAFHRHGPMGDLPTENVPSGYVVEIREHNVHCKTHMEQLFVALRVYRQIVPRCDAIFRMPRSDGTGLSLRILGFKECRTSTRLSRYQLPRPHSPPKTIAGDFFCPPLRVRVPKGGLYPFIHRELGLLNIPKKFDRSGGPQSGITSSLCVLA